jgi:hypothetical protein
MTMLFDRSTLRAPDAPSAAFPVPGTVSPGNPRSPLLTRLFLAAGIGLFLCLPQQADAQQPAPPPPDTLEVIEPVRSPRGAFVRSLVVPGWGHAWVGAPVRGGVYFAMEVGALWMTYKSHQQLREARRQEQWRRDTGQLQPTQLDPLSRAREDQVEDWFTVALFLLFFSGADAFVSAHLADFGERVGVAPAPGGGVQVRAVLPVGGGP